MAKLADAIHFDYIDELCEEILDRLNEDDEISVSVIGTYEGVRAFIKEIMAYDEVEFDSLVIKDPEYNDYYDEYVVDIWNNDGEILFGCEPAKRDGRYLNCEGNILYLLDNVRQAVLNTCEYDEMYFVIVGEDECDCEEDCDCECPCDYHKGNKELSPTSSYTINGKPVSKQEFDKKYAKIVNSYRENMRSTLLDYCSWMDEVNDILSHLW